MIAKMGGELRGERLSPHTQTAVPEQDQNQPRRPVILGAGENDEPADWELEALAVRRAVSLAVPETVRGRSELIAELQRAIRYHYHGW